MKKLVSLLILVFVILGVGSTSYIIYFFSTKEIYLGPSGSGMVGLTVLDPLIRVNLTSPKNITYGFFVEDYINDNMILDLNASANFANLTWRYVLEDLRHGIIYGEIFFEPNTTFKAVRWENRLIVYANDSSRNANDSVDFYVFVPNSNPVLMSLSAELFACEGQSNFSYEFSATDIDEDDLFFTLSPVGPFHPENFGAPIFVNKTMYLTYAEFGIWSEPLDKGDSGMSGWKTHWVNITVDDGLATDRNQTGITVIEINNPPVFNDVENQTLNREDVNNTLYLEMNVSDQEDGNQSSGNLSFNVTFLVGNPIFNVSNLGIINLTLDSSHVGYYEADVCVIDGGMDVAHPNIALCGLDADANKSDCQVLNLTITEDEIIIIPPGEDRGGGGGGGPTPGYCEERWTCLNWRTCENVTEALSSGALAGDDFRAMEDECSEKKWSNVCGFQERSCFDVNGCNKTAKELPLEQACYYVYEPTCEDGVKNCHEGSCELLVDCGGPCEPCPTCTDGVLNQGEEDVDCGGPCPSRCGKEEEVVEIKLAYYFVAILVTIFGLVFAYRLYRYLKVKKQIMKASSKFEEIARKRVDFKKFYHKLR